MARSKAQKEARKARKAAKAAAAAAGAPKLSKSQLRKITKQTIKTFSAPSKKQQTQQYLSGIVSDGKVTKKEVKQAQSKGIRLDRIQGAFDKRFTPGTPFSRPQPRFGSLAARYSPQPTQLQIRPGAQKLITRDVAARAAREVAAPAAAAPAAAAPSPAAIPNPLASQPGGDVQNIYTEESGIDPQIQALMDQIAALQANQPEPFDMEGFMAMQQERDAALQEQLMAQQQAMQQQFQQAMDAQAAAMAEMESKRQQMMQQQQIAFETSAENMARGGLTPDFRIGADPRRSVFGTGGFKRRKPIRPMTIAQGIAPTTAPAAASGAATGNLLNV